jgi:hypothetical protein
MTATSRNLTGRALRENLEDWTGIPTGWVVKPAGVAASETAVYLVVIPLAGGTDEGQQRTHEPRSGGDYRFQIDCVGVQADQAILGLERALTALCGQTAGAWDNAWAGSAPEPCWRNQVGDGPFSRDDEAGIAWASADVQLVVLG